ncbi:hypothetical protein TM239_22360 [Bradyrhizobium sp. TM239]|nr:hypothetical protein TM239_22360 [Bradyrhizobium sp. TM239]
MLSHLRFGGQAVTELVEYEIGIDGGDATHEDHKHPFHGVRLRSRPRIGNGVMSAKFRPGHQPVAMEKGPSSGGDWELGPCVSPLGKGTGKTWQTWECSCPI